MKGSILAFFKSFLLLAAIAAVLFVGAALARRSARTFDPGAPIGPLTARRLAALGGPEMCRAFLENAGIDHARVTPHRSSAQCGHDDAVRLGSDGALALAVRPASLGIRCPLAAAFAMWHWHVVQPAAVAHLGSPVTAIDHFGSYSCRRVYGAAEGRWSEHATANAVDIAGFRLADGRRVSVAGDWNGSEGDAAARSRFLREVRDGGCRLFSTTLSPDYNQAHRDHLHLDMSERWSGYCR